MSITGRNSSSTSAGDNNTFKVSAQRRMAGPDISIIIPCVNEHDNIAPMIEALYRVMDGKNWEVIFVDDNSSDGTSQEIERFARKDQRIRGICRYDRKGLSSAVIEGVLASSAPVFAVMDGDLQHDENQLNVLLTAVIDHECDIAVASRYMQGGNSEGLASQWRHFLSDGGIFFSRKLLGIKLTDPMSGFFASRRACFLKALPHLSGVGFKILLDAVLALPSAKIKEFPALFRPRMAGKSKLGVGVMIAFAHMIFEKLSGGRLSFSLTIFTLIGLVMSILGYALIGVDAGRGPAVVLLVVSLSGAYFLNNFLGFYQCRHRGIQLLMGWIGFVVLGALAWCSSLGVNAFLATQYHLEQPVSYCLSTLWTLVVGYAFAQSYIWRK